MKSVVEGLLRLPTDEVQLRSHIITDEDVSVVLHEMATILRKCLYAIRYSLVTPFTTFLHLLLEAVNRDCEGVTQSLFAPAEEGHCIDLLANMCSTLLCPDGRAFRSDISLETFFELIQLLCASPVLKDPLGAALLSCILAFMHDAVEDEDDHRQPRAGASLLITLIRGSKANKNRMSVECGRLGEVLASSNDIFFQMQCIEIIFRLYTHNRTVLATSTLPEFFKRGVPELPNDANLLSSIQNLLDTYNTENKPSGLRQFMALLVEVGTTEVCGYTKMYFSPLMLVIMIPGCSGENITIPYEHIRSVKLSKERKLGIRLHVDPGKLSGIMNILEGKDTMLVSLTQSTFNAIRSAGIHRWISERKGRVPINRVHQQAEVASVAISVGGTSSDAVVGLPSGGISLKEPEDLEMRDSNHASVTVEGCVSVPLLFPHQVDKQQKQLQQTGSLSGLSSPRRSGGPKTSGENAKEEWEEKGMLFQLHAAASQKVARMRQGAQEELQQVVDFMHEELEKMRRLNARERDDFELSVREDLTAVRRAEAEVKAHAAECLQSLNQELTEVQALGDLLKSEVDKFREGLSAVLGSSESLEEELLVGLKSMVDGEMKSMEATLLQLMSSTNPFSFLTTYLSRKLDADSGSIGVNGAAA